MTLPISHKQRWFTSAPRLANVSQFSMVPAHALADSRLTGRQFKVLCALCLYANAEGRCYVGQDTVAELLGFYKNLKKRLPDNDSVCEAVKGLVAFGWLKKASRGNGLTLNYTLKIPSAVTFHGPASKRVSDDEYAQRAVRFAPLDDLDECDIPDNEELNSLVFGENPADANYRHPPIATSICSTTEHEYAIGSVVLCRNDVLRDDELFIDGLERSISPLVYKHFKISPSARHL